MAGNSVAGEVTRVEDRLRACENIQRFGLKVQATVLARAERLRKLSLAACGAEPSKQPTAMKNLAAFVLKSGAFTKAPTKKDAAAIRKFMRQTDPKRRRR